MSRARGARALAWNCVLAAAALIGVRLCRAGVSYERLGPRQARVLRSRARWLAAHAVRDRESQDHARSWGIPVSAVIPDLAFNLDYVRGAVVSDRSAIAISFRLDKYPDCRDAILRAIRDILLANPGVRSVKMVIQVRRDEAFMQSLMDPLQASSEANFELRDHHQDIEACRRTYQECRAIYSNRLHALLLGASMGAIPVPIVDRERDRKIIGLFELLGYATNINYLDDGMLRLAGARPIAADDWQRQRVLIEEYFDFILAR